MTNDEALDVIEEVLGETVADVIADGLPEGAEEDLGLDDQLVRDIAKACQRWLSRKGR